MRLVYLLLAILASASIAQAQQEVLSKIPKTGKTVEAFIPKGYQIMKNGRVSGDLNKDGLDDCALAVSAYIGENLNSDDNRLLLVLLKTADGYSIKGKSDKVVLCYNCGGVYGDPFDGLEIKNGVLEVTHYGGSSWRWSAKEKFRFQNNNFYRIGTTHDYYWLNANCDDIGNGNRKFKDTNWITGQQELIETDGNCKVTKHVKQKIKVQPLVKLEDYVDNDNE